VNADFRLFAGQIRLRRGLTLVQFSSTPEKAKVYLVGAGPGDPDLLTAKAIRTLNAADVVLHDALVSAEVLALIPAKAQVLNVGKRCGTKSITQDEIHELLLQFNSAGAVVVRLKSGDPLIFGRAGEELDFLRRAGIEVEIVPGITAGIAAAASVQASLTNRHSAEHLVFVSAHRSHGKADSDWSHLVNARTTVVAYMPGEYAGVAATLRHAGLSESTPCVIVSKASCRDEMSHQTTLGLLPGAPVMPSPCILVIGETVGRASPVVATYANDSSSEEGLRHLNRARLNWNRSRL
jgi:uroporphyrin-III C-methyltransferase